MKIAIRGLKWILLGLYVLVVGLILFWVLLRPPANEKWVILEVLGLMFLCQVIFVFGAGTREFLKPVRPRRLAVPGIVAGLMMGVLALGLCLAMGELFYLDKYSWEVGACLVVAMSSWAFWGVLFVIHTRDLERYKVLRNLTAALLAGSLLELLAVVPSHIVVSRRPGCMTGMETMLGIIAGVAVMMWAFGPGILLLFFRGRRQAEMMAKAAAAPTVSGRQV